MRAVQERLDRTGKRRRNNYRVVVDPARRPPDATALQKEDRNFLGKKGIALALSATGASQRSRQIS